MADVAVKAYLEFYYGTQEGENLYVRHWPSSNGKPAAVIQIAHGLGETADYYNDFAVKATASGLSVYIHEARGHGRTAGDVNSPEYSEKGGDIGSRGFDGLRDDLHEITVLIKEQYPGIPVFLLGHSMGAVIALMYTFKYGSDLSGLLLTGFPAENRQLGFLLEMVEEEIRENGLKAPCRNTFNELFKEVRKPFEPMETELDWITSDRRLIEESLRLPYTYVLFNNGFYRSFLLAMTEVYKESNSTAIPRDLPILLISGGVDPLTDNGEGTIALCERYLRAGILNVGFKIYPGMRHSVLREVNRDETAEDIIVWIKNKISEGCGRVKETGTAGHRC
jgi:alpha-beta hydrolase superfamily lysophospholipase